LRSTDQDLNDSLEILIGELVTDDELRDAFLRDPERTLRHANDWALPLSESEVQLLRVPSFRLWDKVAEALEGRLSAAA
jgi:hypothetical protein